MPQATSWDFDLEYMRGLAVLCNGGLGEILGRRPRRCGSDRRERRSLGQTWRLAPRLSKLPGFGSYYLIEAGNGVVTSVGFFETSEQADESTRVAANWIRDEKLDTMIPNAPKITGGSVTVHKTNGVVAAP